MLSTRSWSERSSVMKQQGATLIDPADIATLGKFDESELLVFMYELKADLNAYLGATRSGRAGAVIARHHRLQ